MSLDKDDLWLLEVVVVLTTPLRMLLGSKVALALNMPRSHGLSTESLGEKLASLSERGLIRIHQSGDESVVARTRAEIERVLVEGVRFDPKAFAYGLTPRGGDAWEHYARPDWSRFVDVTVGSDPNVCVIEAASLEAAEREYHLHEHDGSEQRVLPDTKQGEVLVPWEATYWKTFPEGYRIRYAWVPQEMDIPRILSQTPEPPWYSSLPLDR